MREKIREAFDSVHAEPELKAAARQAVARRAARRHRPIRRLGIALAAAACAVVLAGGWLYATPTVQISIDINPSLELGINRFDRVISVEGWNDDGTALAQTVNVTHLSYTDAVETILASEPVETLLAENGVVEIGVIGTDTDRCARMLENVRACTREQQNAHCYQADPDQLAQAHGCGLSYGKYRAYLELAALDPAITPEAVQDMTMREIRERIAALSGQTLPAAADDSAAAATEPTENGLQQKTPGHHGAGHHGDD